MAPKTQPLDMPLSVTGHKNVRCNQIGIFIELSKNYCHCKKFLPINTVTMLKGRNCKSFSTSHVWQIWWFAIFRSCICHPCDAIRHFQFCVLWSVNFSAPVRHILQVSVQIIRRWFLFWFRYLKKLAIQVDFVRHLQTHHVTYRIVS